MSNIPFKKLTTWQKSMHLAKAVYQLTHDLPSTEKYGLSAQLRSAAVSIPSNIAEGSQRGTDREFVQYLRIAKGSLAEIETQILLAQELQYVPEEAVKKLLSEIFGLSKMLRAFIATIATR